MKINVEKIFQRIRQHVGAVEAPAPRPAEPLAGLLIVDRLAKRAVTFDRMLGALMFLALAVFGEFSVGYWIESLHHP